MMKTLRLLLGASAAVALGVFSGCSAPDEGAIEGDLPSVEADQPEKPGDEPDTVDGEVATNSPADLSGRPPAPEALGEPADPKTYITASRSGNTAYAFAGFRWSDGGGVYDLDLSVYDWKCDAHPTYAYVEYDRGGVISQGANRVDYSGCDTGDWTNFNDLNVPDGGTVRWIRLVVCIDTNNNVQSGGQGGRSGDDCTKGTPVYRP